MRTIKIKSGGVAYILEDGETAPSDSISFLEAEWAYTKRLAQHLAKTDPEAHQAYWESVLLKKREIPGYLIYADFPIYFEPKKEAKNFPGADICAQILETLRGRGNVEKKHGEGSA